METEEKKGIGRLNVILIVILVILAIALVACIIIRGSADTKTSYLEYAGLEDDSRIRSNEFVYAFYSNIYIRGKEGEQTLTIPDLSAIYNKHKTEISGGNLYDVMVENMSESIFEVEYSEGTVLEVVEDFVITASKDLDSVDVLVDVSLPES